MTLLLPGLDEIVRYGYQGNGKEYGLLDLMTSPVGAGSVHGSGVDGFGGKRTVVDTYASTELVVNGGFETAGSPFGTWTANVTDGAIDRTTTAGEFASGTAAAKLTAGANKGTNIAQGFIVIPGQSYSLTVKTRGDGSNSGQYAIYDNTHASWIASKTSFGVTGTSYQTPPAVVFQAPAGCTSVWVYLYCATTLAGVCYYDDVSLLPTAGLLSISGEQTVVAGCKAQIDPRISYDGVARVPGRVFVSSITPYTNTGLGPYLALVGATDLSNYASGVFYFRSDGVAYILNPGLVPLFPYTGGVTYHIACVMRATGMFFYVKGGIFTVWTLVWVSTVATTTPMYPWSASYGNPYTWKVPRWCPSDTFNQAPLLYDSFNRADGAIGNSDGLGQEAGGAGVAWPGSTWTVSGNKAVNTPTLGADLFDAGKGTFDSGTGSWTVYGSNTIANDSGELRITYVDNASGAYLMFRDSSDLSADLVRGQCYKVTLNARVSAGASVLVRVNPNDGIAPLAQTVTSTTKVPLAFTFIAGSTTGCYIQTYGMDAGEIIWLDDIVIKPIAVAAPFNAPLFATPNVKIRCVPVYAAGYQVGLAGCLDDKDNPLNFLRAFFDGLGNLRLDKILAGVPSNLINVATSYSAGTVLELDCWLADANTMYLRVYYGTTAIGTVQTLTRAGGDGAIIDGLRHGMFATDPSVSIDSVEIQAKDQPGIGAF